MSDNRWAQRVASPAPVGDPGEADVYRRERAHNQPASELPPPPLEEAVKALAHHSRALWHLLELERLEAQPARMLEPMPVLGPPATGSQIGWTFTDQSKEQSQSIGVYNPPANPRIFVGLDTGRASLASSSIPVAPGKLLVVPVPVFDLTLGVDPADQGGIVAPFAVFAWRYPTRASAYLGG